MARDEPHNDYPPDATELIAAAERQLRRAGAGACLIKKPGEDLVVVVGPAETARSLLNDDIRYRADASVPGLDGQQD